MARMVRSNIYPEGVYELPPTPEVASELQRRYQETLPDRVAVFPANDTEELFKVPRGDDGILSNFRHLLRYDAESIFWLLLWWCIQAQPVEGVSSDIPQNYWFSLVGEPDR